MRRVVERELGRVTAKDKRHRFSKQTKYQGLQPFIPDIALEQRFSHSQPVFPNPLVNRCKPHETHRITFHRQSSAYQRRHPFDFAQSRPHQRRAECILVACQSVPGKPCTQHRAYANLQRHKCLGQSFFSDESCNHAHNRRIRRMHYCNQAPIPGSRRQACMI